MKDYGKTRSTLQPEKVVIDESSVWVRSNIEPITETTGQSTFEGYQYDMVQYDKDEYILLISEKNSQLEAQVTDTQVALCEIYEGLGGVNYGKGIC